VVVPLVEASKHSPRRLLRKVVQQIVLPLVRKGYLYGEVFDEQRFFTSKSEYTAVAKAA